MHDIEVTVADIIDVAFKLHKDLGPGLFESVYEAILAVKLVERGHAVIQQCPIDIVYDGLRLESAFRADLIVNNRIVVEVKSIERLAPVHGKQVLTYLRLLKQPVGLLINFGGATLKEGLRRIVNSYIP
ncbi:GxxExxY protein [Sphingomonas sp.]|uniref:GxxExxY protein n=1 Tax=Sphingomonas sp. TaxID=28214 RepID=UPI002ED7A594